MKKNYKSNDYVPIGCEDCNGCCSCCTHMGDSIIQDPFDFWLFSNNMQIAGGGKITFEMLVFEDGPWELSFQDGLLLPNIKMVEEGRCPFLNKNGRCQIHNVRSGLCRLFPLGRQFIESEMYYVLLGANLGCEKLKPPAKAGTEVLIRDWLGYDNIEDYEKFQILWHDIKVKASEYCAKLAKIEARDFQIEFLEEFYQKPYGKNFFKEFVERFEKSKIKKIF